MNAFLVRSETIAFFNASQLPVCSGPSSPLISPIAATDNVTYCGDGLSILESQRGSKTSDNSTSHAKSCLSLHVEDPRIIEEDTDIPDCPVPSDTPSCSNVAEKKQATDQNQGSTQCPIEIRSSPPPDIGLCRPECNPTNSEPATQTTSIEAILAMDEDDEVIFCGIGPPPEPASISGSSSFPCIIRITENVEPEPAGIGGSSGSPCIIESEPAGALDLRCMIETDPVSSRIKPKTSKARIETLIQEKRKAQDALTANMKRVASYDEKLQKHVENLRKKLTLKNKEVAHIKSELVTTKGQSDHYHKAVYVLEDKIKDLSEQKAALLKRVEEAEKNRAPLDAQQLQKEMKELRSEHEKELREKDEKIKKLQKSVKTAHKMVVDLVSLADKARKVWVNCEGEGL